MTNRILVMNDWSRESLPRWLAATLLRVIDIKLPIGGVYYKYRVVISDNVCTVAMREREKKKISIKYDTALQYCILYMWK